MSEANTNLRVARRSHRGVTIIEVLIVILIVSVLTAILIPALRGAMESRNNTVDLSNLRQTMIDFQVWAGSNQGVVVNAGLPDDPAAVWFYGEHWNTERAYNGGMYFGHSTTWTSVLAKVMDGGPHWHSSYEDFLIQTRDGTAHPSTMGLPHEWYSLYRSKYRMSLTMLTSPEAWVAPGLGIDNTRLTREYGTKVRFDQIANPSAKGVLYHRDWPGWEKGLMHVAFADGSAALRHKAEAKPTAVFPTSFDRNRPGAPVNSTLNGYRGSDF